MRYRSYLSRWFILCLFILVGCGPDDEAIAVTVAEEVAHALAATLTAEPVATAYPTATPYPPATAYPTATALPTHTPYPTQGPYPTATAYPTDMPALEEVTVTVTAAAAVPSTTSVQSPTPTVTSSESTVLQTLFDLRLAIQSFMGIIDEAFDADAPNMHCTALIQQYDTIMAYPTFDVSSAALEVQNAYTSYRAAINRVNGVGGIPREGNGAVGLIEHCRNFINNSTQENITESQLSLARLASNAAVDVISQAIRTLGGE